MATESEVQSDLDKVDGNKAKLMQQYSDEQKKILNMYGGNVSDLPASGDNPYHAIQSKITILNQMAGVKASTTQPITPSEPSAANQLPQNPPLSPTGQSTAGQTNTVTASQTTNQNEPKK